MYMYIQHEDGGMFKSQGPVACVSVNEYINDVWAIHTINWRSPAELVVIGLRSCPAWADGGMRIGY